MVLIDEPEAFLHPPQVRRLAEVVTRETSEDSQIIIATHSDEMVRGLLDASGDRVVVARLIRRGDKNEVSVLPTDRLVDLWTDPTLRTSDVLSALFHDVSLLCEGESDARFYRALLDATRGEQRDADHRFYSFGGKDRIPAVVKALRPLDVPLVVIVDIDVLSDKGKFAALFEAVGGNYSLVESDHKAVVAAVQSRKGQITAEELARELRGVANRLNGQAEVPKAIRDELSRLSRQGSNWNRLKEDGSIGLVHAEAIKAYDRVFEASSDLGLLIVSEGELEGFCRKITRTRG